MGIKSREGQMKIQQMAFMIVAVFIFFILVGLFVLNWQFRGLKSGATELGRQQAISSLEIVSNMPELSCSSSKTLCIDQDKARIMSGQFGQNYSEFWPVASIKIYKVYPEFSSEIKCPALNCNYWEIYDNGQSNRQEYSTYVSLCERIKESGYVYDNCEIGKLVVGVEINEEE